MGPPKKPKFRVSFDEQKRRNNFFEYRVNIHGDQSCYMYNPYTGETIFSTDLDYMDRSKSMWAPIEAHPNPASTSANMYSLPYNSRVWGRREFNGWSSEESAATHIAAVTRGWIAREALRKYFRTRYQKRLCNFSGYYYIYDTFNTDPQVDSSWYKPRLAHPNDIVPYEPADPDDYLQGDKYTTMGFEKGPYFRRHGLPKAQMIRSKTIAFEKPNPLRERALKRPEEIDLEKTPLKSLVAYFDGNDVFELYISDHAMMRVAVRKSEYKN